MRTSRRNSHIAAPVKTVLAAATLAAAALGVSACGSAGSAPIAPLTMSSGSGSSGPAGVTDIQILNSLEMTTDALNASFGSNDAWRSWSPTTTDKDKIGYTAFLKCKGGLDSTGATLAPAITTFEADTLPADSSTPAAPTSTPTSGKSTGKKKPSGNPSSSSSSSTSTTVTGLPKHWVISIAAVYQTAAQAKKAATGVGQMDSANSDCGKSADGGNTPLPQYIGGQIGETEPTWYGEDPTVGFVVTKTNYAMTAVAQQRGRFVVVTVTSGTANLKNSYYALNSIPDTDSAAEAATSLLGQLTNAVVNGG